MNPQKIPMGLVVLQGQGDLTVLLVSPEISELIEHVVNNNIQIVQEYNGLIY